MPRKSQYTKKMVADALERASGIQAGAAQLLGCDRSLITQYVARFPELGTIRDRAVERAIDMAETNISRAMADSESPHNFAASKYFLDRKGKDRGYVLRQEVTGKDGGPQEHKTTINDERVQAVGEEIDRILADAAKGPAQEAERN